MIVFPTSRTLHILLRLNLRSTAWACWRPAECGPASITEQIADKLVRSRRNRVYEQSSQQ
jgi:hypothetical protein